MCKVTDVQFIAREDMKVFKSARIKDGVIVSRYPPSGRSVVEGRGYISRGAELSYRVGEKVTSPSGPGLMSFLQRKDAETSATGGSFHDYCVLECTIPKGSVVCIVVDDDGFVGFASKELVIDRAYKQCR